MARSEKGLRRKPILDYENMTIVMKGDVDDDVDNAYDDEGEDNNGDDDNADGDDPESRRSSERDRPRLTAVRGFWKLRCPG